MNEFLKSRVSRHRWLLQNQYAHLEYLDIFESEKGAEQTTASLDREISASRKLLQDPYAYLNDSGGYSAELNCGDKMPVLSQPEQASSDSVPSESANRASAPRRYSDNQIETLTRDLHIRLWKGRASLWDGAVPSDPVDLLDPAVALHLVGYEFAIEESLGQYRGDSGHVEVAGLIDRAAMRVQVSRQFPVSVRTFTAAHELGHAVLHSAGGGIHRDRPLDGVTLSRDPFEFEADKFATYFLMPAKLVRTRFFKLFGTEHFALTDDTAFALSSASLHEVQVKFRTRRDLSRFLASTEHYNHHYFSSIASQFRVSIEAMAIRLEELALLGG